MLVGHYIPEILFNFNVDLKVLDCMKITFLAEHVEMIRAVTSALLVPKFM